MVGGGLGVRCEKELRMRMGYDKRKIAGYGIVGSLGESVWLVWSILTRLGLL